MGAGPKADRVDVLGFRETVRGICVISLRKAHRMNRPLKTG